MIKGVQVKDLERGKVYKIVYKIPTVHRYARVSVMSFMAPAPEGGSLPRESLLFNARPAAGTQEMAIDWIVSIEEVPADTKRYCDRRA
jgi:hypothetical protein